MSTTETIQRFYDSISDPYARAWDHNFHLGYWDDPDEPVTVEAATERLTDEVLRRLVTAPGDAVLDVGCGIGKPAIRLAATRDLTVTGVSISEEQIDAAQRVSTAYGLADRARFVAADAADLPFPAASYDAVFALESLHHMADRGRVLAEIARVLKADGSFVIADYALRHPPTPGQEQIVTEFRSACHLATLSTIDEYVADVTAAGFVPIEVVDVSEHVQPSLFQHVQAMRDARAELVGNLPPGAFDRMIESSERYGQLSAAGYVVIACRRGRQGSNRNDG
ncbi:SAM-dependent methyltransferase [Micromonospora sp. WMMD723]|uniref:SAM-dependent methyltransferase n=1 Tax=unclassified Micromonospora TaxID=2617518 RepID=UPI003B93E132